LFNKLKILLNNVKVAEGMAVDVLGLAAGLWRAGRA
jgi:hypothetical protein